MSIVADTWANLVHRIRYNTPLLECPDGKLRNMQAGDNLGNAALPAGAATLFPALPAKAVPATPAAAEAVSASVPGCHLVTVIAGGAGTTYVGGAGVTVAGGAAPGIPLASGDAKEFYVSDPALIFCIGSAAGCTLAVVCE
jgi:hypothetical protein